MKGWMKPRRSLLLILVLTAVLAGAAPAAGSGSLFQVSTLQALLNGVYDGDCTFRELQGHGDFGLGTFDALDGEMIALDGRFYQIRADGKVYPVAGSMKTPFAEVTFFKPDRTVQLREPQDYRQLQRLLESLRRGPNLLYALKVDGRFSHLRVRSVPRQPRPYPGLVEATRRQAVFEFHEVRGVMVGFLLPAYLAGINAPGGHCHFITADRQAGGHVLDCRVQAARLDLQELTAFTVQLPRSAAFAETVLAGPRQAEVEKAEK